MKISRRAWLMLILLAAFALRLYRLGVSSLWYDETVSTFLAQQDLIELTRHTAGDIHPPLYYYLLHFWTRAAGTSEFSFAFFSLFCGVILIALVYHVARDWFNTRVALIAALLVTISPYNLWYSQEVRMYTLGATLGLASVYFFVRLLSHQSSVVSRQIFFSRDFVAYAIISAAGIYTLYYFAFLLVFENLVALVWIIRKARFQSPISNLQSLIGVWLFSQLAILILYLPWASIAFRQATDPPVPPWRSFTSLSQVLLESLSALTLGQSIDPMMALPLLIIVAVVILFALKSSGQRSAVSGLFLLGFTFVPLAIIYALSLWKPLYHVRYVFIYSPAFYILLALGLEELSNSQLAIRNLRFTLYALLILLFAASAFSTYNFWFNPQYAKDDLRGAVNYIAEHWRPGDAILINAGYSYTAFAYYYDQPIAWRGRLTDYPPPDVSLGTYQRLVDLRNSAIVLQTGSIGGAPNLGWGDSRSDFYATTAEETRAALDRVFAAHPRVWMLRLYDTVVDPDGVIRDYLATRGRIIDDRGFTGESYARVQGYLTTRAPITATPSNIVRRDVVLGNRIVLLGFEPASTTARIGTPIDVNVYWQAKEPTNIDERLFIGLYAEDGTHVASNDELLIGNALGTSRWTPGEILHEPVRLNIPQHVSPGIYILRVSMYNPLTNESLSALPSEWIVDNQIILLRLTIE